MSESAFRSGSTGLTPDQMLPANAITEAIKDQRALRQIEELIGLGEISNQKLVAWLRSYLRAARGITPYPAELQRIDTVFVPSKIDQNKEALLFSDGHGSDDPLVTGHERQI